MRRPPALTEKHRRILRAMRDGQWHRLPWIEYRAVKVGYRGLSLCTLNLLAERGLIERECANGHPSYRLVPKGRKVLQDEELRLYREHSIPLSVTPPC